jgi:hypothetical protein
MRMSWKVICLAGVAPTGVLVTRKRRAHRHYDTNAATRAIASTAG